VWFRWGEGEVFHMISHYYLQRTELRMLRHQAPAASYFAENDLAMSAEMRAGTDDLCLADVASAKPSATFMANVMASKKERARRATRERATTRTKADAAKGAQTKPEGA